MDPASCAEAYGRAVGAVCKRAVELGWNATTAVGWLSALAGVLSGFVFAALVVVLTSQDPEDEASEPGGRFHVRIGDSMPVLLGGFVALLADAFMYAALSAVFHPLKVPPLATLAAAVFCAGVVQAFVALAWLFAAFPRGLPAYATAKLAARFVMFNTGIFLYLQIAKAHWVVHGRDQSDMAKLSWAALLAGPWLLVVLSRYLAHSGLQRRTRQLPGWLRGHVLPSASFWLSLIFMTSAVVAFVFVLNRRLPVIGTAYPYWMVLSELLGTGVLFALYELNLPPVHTSRRAAPTAGPAQRADDEETRLDLTSGVGVSTQQ